MKLKEIVNLTPRADGLTLSWHAAILRRQGFAIVARPNKGPNIWQRHGEKMTEEAALQIAWGEAEKEQPKTENKEKARA